MKKISLTQDENLSFKVSQQLSPQESQRFDLYFSIPEEMGINAITLSEDNYFHSSIRSHSAYFSRQVHLPLVRSRFISQKKGDQGDYRSNLNLFSYQFRVALETDIKQALQEKDIEIFYQYALELVDQTQSLLKKLRRYTPLDQKLSSYFENVDNYLSWYTEQSFLNLLANGPKSSEHAETRDVLFALCRQENNYRTERQYNSKITLADPNRITNKMRLLQRLSEFGVVFKRTTHDLDNNLRRLVRGSITAVVMAFVMSIVLNARSAFNEVTLVLITFLGVIYGVREIFKDDLTRYLWRKIQRGRPKWQHVFTDSLSKNKMSMQTLWLDYIKNKDLPDIVNKHFQQRRQQNKQAAQLLHFRCNSKVIAKEFIPGFKEIQHQMFFNLTPFVRFLKKGEGRLYALDGSKISNQGVERRYQINLAVVQEQKIPGNKTKQYIQRFKITMNRSKIINIEGMKSEQNFEGNPQ
ncbi:MULTISPECIES: hypothetical protein [unclassified Colwellia]|uniref:hypothetical protein n=1 Tax=unclassified Colwellia TaxID=196834 RepID=UPI0015F3C52F|nr:MULTISPECIES: hypothetical protein [unclassified Colwellia]MBA6379595.1 hypothetical protein [Colwellia sp. BRX10-7]MBA6386192.1 hypothetical protein [Colwellia sp. BRX10-2]MBA6403134.1 hypothetical protein [Colwellia sp. BRX10-5]MBA6405919.1 hypothetical protein [Colwellia sp. BRX10-1]